MARRGRPFGHRLTEETKDKIREARTGMEHSKDTRSKISDSLLEYFMSPPGVAQRLVMSIRKKEEFRRRLDTPAGRMYRKEMSVILKSLWSTDEGLQHKSLASAAMKKFFAETN